MRRRKFWRVLMCEKGVFAWDFVSLFNKLLWSKSVLRSQQTNGKPIERGLCFLPQGQSLSSGELQQRWKYVINHVWNSKNAWFHWKKRTDVIDLELDLQLLQLINALRMHGFIGKKRTDVIVWWLGTWFTTLAIDQCLTYRALKWLWAHLLWKDVFMVRGSHVSYSIIIFFWNLVMESCWPGK
jgi:hypothetical protein